MTKKLNLNNHSVEDLQKLSAERREELRSLRFNVAGSKNRDVKRASKLRKEVARAMTELSKRNPAKPPRTK